MSATKTAPKARPAAKATTAKKSPAKATRAPKAKATAPTVSGPRKETLDFAKKVVALRDAKGLAWKAVASALDVPYDQNGSSRLRRAYTLGGGKTVGARAAKPAPKATRSRAAKTTKTGR